MEENQYNAIVQRFQTMAQHAALILSCCSAEEVEYGQELQMQQSPEQILKTVFGYDSFRPLQREIIQNVLDGRDTLAIMPTGGIIYMVYRFFLQSFF